MAKVSRILELASDESPNGLISLVTIDSVHREIHDGRFYTVSINDLALAAGASLEVLIRVAPGTGIHLRPSVALGGDGVAFLFEGPTVSADGVAATPQNRNRFSPNTSVTEIYSGPTVTDDGTELVSAVLPGGSVFLTPGATSDLFEEWILSPGDYLGRLTNDSGAAQIAGISLDYYEIS